MLESYGFFEYQSIMRDRMKPTFEDMKFDPLDEKMYSSQTTNVIVFQIICVVMI